MSWLQEHMRDHIRNPIDPPENILNFPHGASGAVRSDAATALDLLSQAAEAIRNDQYRVGESEARARYLAERAIENLQRAEAQIRSAESMRRSAEEELQKVSARLEKTETELTRIISRIADAEAQLAKAEECRRATEVRAMNAEQAFKQLEHAIRTQLVELGKGPIRRSVRAA
jgi:chromosome segregation ATPase